MKQSTLLIIVLAIYAIIIARGVAQLIDTKTYYARLNGHECVDKTHKTCDGECECDGLGCQESETK